jgi:hypothetical protein
MTEKQIYKALQRIDIDRSMLKNAERCWDAICAYLAKYLERELKVKEGHSNPKLEAQALKIYSIYPRKCARPAALRAIIAAMKKYNANDLSNQVSKFAEAWKNADAEELRYCPHAATYFHQERFNDPIVGSRRQREALRGENI